MLKSLCLNGVGPSKKFGPIEFAERLNFITGDNGLGKSFLLDITWWVLTRTWARNRQAVPREDAKRPSIEFVFSKAGGADQKEEIRWTDFLWPQPPARPPISGLVIYAGADGSFSAWDPVRNYWSDSTATNDEKIRTFNLSPDEVWNGACSEKGTRICNGLIKDWVTWQRSPEDSSFSELMLVLETLSPGPDEKLMPGKPRVIGTVDVTEYPTIKTPYGEEIPLIYASAGIRRICALAYWLIWTWNAHKRVIAKSSRKPAKEIIFLIDEIECHLHPQWQRTVVPALLKVMQAISGNSQIEIQIIVTTHSPLVLASVESAFDVDLDAIFNIQLQKGNVKIETETWSKQGDVTNWLVSSSFGLQQARSIDAEIAIGAAEAWMRDDKKNIPATLQSAERIHNELVRVLPGSDHFWPRWIMHKESHEKVARPAKKGNRS